MLIESYKIWNQSCVESIRRIRLGVPFPSYQSCSKISFEAIHKPCLTLKHPGCKCDQKAVQEDFSESHSSLHFVEVEGRLTKVWMNNLVIYDAIHSLDKTLTRLPPKRYCFLMDNAQKQIANKPSHLIWFI